MRFVVPKGRAAAEKRLSAIAALHAPAQVDHGIVGRVDLGVETICPECSRGRHNNVRWPCSTVRLLGPWPGEDPEA